MILNFRKSTHVVPISYEEEVGGGSRRSSGPTLVLGGGTRKRHKKHCGRREEHIFKMSGKRRGREFTAIVKYFGKR